MGQWSPPEPLHAPAAQPPAPTPARTGVSQLPYSPGLDGLRALAVIGVIVYHANHTWLSGGFLGVEVFFVISGYLITLLMIAEHERTDRIRLGQFWIRRARRLLPALFVMLAAVAVYLALFNRRPLGRSRGDVVAGLAYGSNWYQIAVGQGYTAADAFVPLRHLWSLAVEEQFYLLWPLVMVVILRGGRERLPRVALWLAAASVAIAVAVGLLYVGGDIPVDCSGSSTHGYVNVVGRCISINETLYLSTVTRAGGLLMGAAFAMWWRPLALLRGPMRKKGHLLDAFALIGIIGLILLSMRVSLSEPGQRFGVRFDPWLFRGGFFLTGLVTLVLIAAVVHRHAFVGRLLGNPVFRWVGTRSYGLYLYHWPIYQIIRKSAGVGLTVTQFVIALVITLPVTELSYRFIELPIRQRRLLRGARSGRRQPMRVVYRRRRRLLGLLAAVSSVVGFASVSLAVADNVCVGDVECSLESADGGEALTDVTIPTNTTTTTDPDDGPTTTDSLGSSPTTDEPTDSSEPEPTEPTTPSTDTGPDPTSVDTTTPVTDPAPVSSDAPAPSTPAPSTTITPRSPLPPVALGESVMLGAVEELRAGGFVVDAAKNRQADEMASVIETLRAHNQLGDVVVIQIGTNGTVTDDDFARIMAPLDPSLTGQVIFLTVTAPKPWTPDNNIRIRDLAKWYPNVDVLDWQVAADTVELCPDRVHLVCGGNAEQSYANMIFDAIGRSDLKR